MIDPSLRQALGLLERTAADLGRVTAWPSDPETPVVGTPWGLHAVPTMVLVLRGAMRLEGPGRRCDLGPGQALLLEPACLHRHGATHASSVVLSLGVLPAWCDLALHFGTGQAWVGRLPRHPTYALLEAALLAKDGEARRQRTGAVLRQVLGERLDDLDLDRDELGPMIGLLWRRSADPSLTVADLVAASGMSRASAYRRFRAGYGTTPAEAIVATRLALAGWLLQRGVAVAEVARRAGFPSRATFTRAWRRRSGVPPSRMPGRAGVAVAPAAAVGRRPAEARSSRQTG